MGHTLQLYYGSTTVDLNDGTNTAMSEDNSRFPAAPLWSAQEISQLMQDGADIEALSYMNVDEAIKIDVMGANAAACQSTINSIQGALREAVEYNRSKGRQGAKCFLKFDPGATGTVWRSEVLYGEVQEDFVLGGYWAAAWMTITIHLRRRFFWENNADTVAVNAATIYNPVPRVTGTGIAFVDGGAGDDSITDTGSGLAVFSIGDVFLVNGSVSNDGAYTVKTVNAGTITVETGSLTGELAGATVYLIGTTPHNYVTTASISGVLPTPAEVMLQNTYNDTDEDTDVFAGVGAFYTQATLTHIIEAEDALEVAGAGAATVDNNCSGGKYLRSTSAGDVEVLAYRWTIADAQVAKFAGRPVRILARFTGTVVAAYCRVTIEYPAGVAGASATEFETTQVTLLDTSKNTHDLGELHIPPWLANAADVDAVSVILLIRKVGGWTLDLDYIQLTPVDSFAIYRPAYAGVEYNERLYDDPQVSGLYNALYVSDSSQANKRGTYVREGGPLMLYPGRTQRVYFLVNASGQEVFRTSQITIEYRARRLTL